MNIDDLIKDMEAFEQEGAEFATPIQYAKTRPVHAPQIYGWLRKGVLSWKRCDCGRKVINVQEADDLLRSKGKLPPITESDDDAEEPEG